MDKYEYKVRADEIKELIARGDYLQAAEIADTIDWRRVKSVMMLCTISDLYKINRRYEDARDMLLLAYERRPGGRTICYSLCELSIKMEEYVQAVEYYKEFVQVAPKDSGRYILQYKLYEAQDVSLEERIEVLEVLKKRDYREKWAYELAYLYHRVGLATRCVEECDEMILWFGEGRYVIKAMELKMLHQPLTPEQQEKYDNRFLPRPAHEDAQPAGAASQEYEDVQEFPAETAEDLTLGDTKIYTPINMDRLMAEQLQQGQPQMETVPEVEPKIVQESEDEMDIHVKTMDVGQYNTMNLQAELAAGLREVLGEDNTEAIQDPIMQSIIAPMMESDTGDMEQMPDNEVNAEEEQIEESEVFFGETGEIGDLDLPEQYAQQNGEEFQQEEMPRQTVPDVTAEIVMEQMRLEGTGENEKGADSQIRLTMPEAESVEKQITGQMCIEDILAEWERVKRENEEKRKEEVRKHVLQQTGSMFSQFEASVRDGLLEQLESGQIESVAEAETIANAAGNGEGVLEEEFLEEFEELPSDEEYEEEFIEEEVSEEAAEELAEEEVPEETAEDVVEEEVPEEAAEELAEEEVPEETAEDVVEEEVSEEAAGELAEEEVSEEAAEELAEEEVPEEIAEDVAEEEVSEEATEEVVEEEAAEGSSEEEADETSDKITEAIWAVTEGEEDEEEIEDLDEPDERPSVERDKAKVRALTRDEKELYATFIQSKKAREQLVQALDNISLAAYTGNVIITGEEGMDTLTLAKNMVREIQMTDSNFSGKVAKISGSALNKRDVAAIVRDLENGALIIQKAADMNSKTAAVLNKSLQRETLGIIVVLEDTKRAMNHFLSEHPTLHNCFTARMDVEALSDDTLVAFGRQYAREMEYAIDEMGMLALHTRIADLQTSDHIVTVMEVKKIVDEAIYRADKKTVGHFFDVLLAKRYDAEDMIILSEKDFI